MKKDVYIIRFVCFVFCFVAFIIFDPESRNGNLLAQDSLKLPIILPAGKPQVIQIPKTNGSSYTIQTKNGKQTIQLEPSKVFTLPVVTTPVLKNKQGTTPDQFAAGKVIIHHMHYR